MIVAALVLAAALGQDKTFLTDTVQDSIGEVSVCKMAEQKTSNATIKSFCARAIADHTKMASDANHLAQQLGLSIPQAPTAESKETKNKLSALSGTQFDAAFLRDQVKDHQQDIAKDRDALSSIEDPPVKALDQEGLPTLRTHLKLATAAMNTVH